MILFAPSLQQLMSGRFDLEDQEAYYYKPYLDLTFDGDIVTRRGFISRGRIVDCIRQSSDNLGLLEVGDTDDELDRWECDCEAVKHSPQRPRSRPVTPRRLRALSGACSGNEGIG
ncbi:uncharacterized protein PHACADRAFT_258815 [Phanerochaete carnosa HHB-10118-sp]|uniref:Uncharacterized protein n=1 Tax=Phanerochaete carnosa (strain HHB-10118-sp) TaxID=650164 RepID=K5W6I3_PHACS|nr:uncharacterized protein PHACADRAFT_258815 [Phanerochaete carnosa HHB-10118-sp]EKM54760.1 hypothetical protein PHACADRAFT_258815 [Phanerochaete carnosa HHB-10118-sp]